MIGNIVISDKLKVDENFNVVNSLDDTIEGIPTLIVGLGIANKLGIKLNYVDRKIDDKTYWTFSKKEKRNIFEEDLFYFIENSYNSLINNIDYTFIDVVLFSDDEVKSIFNYIKKSSDVVSTHIDDMLYIFMDKRIFGIDLNQIKFVGGDVEKLVTRIKRWSNVFLDNKEILIEYKNTLGMLNDEVKYIPLLYSITENG
jgi:hypothetical protein